MQIFTQVRKGTYVDSLASLSMMSVLMDHEGVESAYAGMASKISKSIIADLGLLTKEIEQAHEDDLVIAVRAQSKEVFDRALEEIDKTGNQAQRQTVQTFNTIDSALATTQGANICSISVPGEYACEVTKQALNRGLHCVVFSSNVPLEKEREMKELARQKGLLCMGPDCGVANINGAAFVLSSINNRGPFGIVGASGCGIQHVAAMLHEMGSGVTQTIGTGGKDLTHTVGGISFLMGMDALEDDPATKYIILISRKPDEDVLDKIVRRIKSCKKPVIACLMGADKEKVRSSGAVWAENLDACGAEALKIIGKEYTFDSETQLDQWAKEAVQGMRPEQKYVRGVFAGGTYCDEAMKTMQEVIGGIHSNCPLRPELMLEDSYVSVGNTVIDSGEEEFTLGKPHPALEPSVRLPLIEKEGDDPQTAVILLDLILCPPEHIDPAGVTVKAIKAATDKACARGGKIAVVASVLGTDADFQNVNLQREELRNAGVYVCRTNRQAAKLAAKIAKLRNGEQDI